MLICRTVYAIASNYKSCGYKKSGTCLDTAFFYNVNINYSLFFRYLVISSDRGVVCERKR
jgi:predicted transcriptional regulator